jgi:cell division ATPase FtsA
MLRCDGYLSQSFNLALVPISKDDRILGVLVLDIGGEHSLLPRHVVRASAVDNPA